MLTRIQLEAFLEVADHRSIQGAARQTGKSRATYVRHLDALQQELGAPTLMHRAAGQRQGILTPTGEELARRARVLLQYWDQWLVAARDALARDARALRVGTLPGAFDLVADALAELRGERTEVEFRLIEVGDDQLLGGVLRGTIDVGVGTIDTHAGIPSRLDFHTFGTLPWVVILPRALARRFRDSVRLSDLNGVPLVVPRTGTARDRLEQNFAEYAAGPQVLNAAYEVASTPRVVEMVARGFGPAIVSSFRVAFLPSSVVMRPLVDGPPPLTGGVFVRRGYVLEGMAKTLVTRMGKRFVELATLAPQTKRPPSGRPRALERGSRRR